MNKQAKTEVRTFCVDGDSIAVIFRFDEQWKVWIGEYPFFKEEPRYTPTGRPWRNAIHTECTHYCGGKHNDCGTCQHFTKENPEDLIGVCFCEQLRLKQNENLENNGGKTK